MKRKVIFIFTLLIVCLSFAQQKNVNVQYVVKIDNEKELFNSNPSLRQMFDNARMGSNNLQFNLIINNSGSKFYENSILSISENNIKNATLFTGYSGITYQFENNIFQEMNYIEKGTLIKEPLKDNWELQNETKMIDNYLCYKATNVNRIDNGSGKIFNHPVIAWYCPELPYRYGPNGYSNLPGLILELQVRNVIFGAKKIDLNSNINFDLSFLQNVKTISLEAYNKQLEQNAENFKG
ncbi:GLPGLI family protein [Flavobacterium antarcticum]|uniref:GLPGLI family protein n=1 Tax=Flavobacterium antarcticum TaxID=271155 RepID=UPI0003B411BC|nr:GLPGLI family protein [Flavobacterium antarcticum]